MGMEQLTEFFGWMMLINVGLMILSAVLIMAMKGFICKVHGKMFAIPEDKLMVILYSYLGVYKIFIIVFCLVPYLALKLM